jgi:hypothetical protein
MHNSHATLGFNSNKTRKTRTNKSNNKAKIKLTRKHQFSNVLARAKTLEWRYFVKALATIFDFELLPEEPYVPLFGITPASKVHTLKGRVHAVVLLRLDGAACVDLHEDVGKSPYHKVLRQTRRLNTLSKQLSRALVKFEEVYGGKSGSIKLYDRKSYLIPPRAACSLEEGVYFWKEFFHGQFDVLKQS